MTLEGFQAISDILRSGVYVLAHRGEVVYVGKSKLMLGRVYTHRSMTRRGKGQVPKWLPVKGIVFDEVYIQPCALEAIDALERAMIDKYKPRHNVVHKTPEATAQPIAVQIGGVTLVLNARAKAKIERRV